MLAILFAGLLEVLEALAVGGGQQRSEKGVAVGEGAGSTGGLPVSGGAGEGRTLLGKGAFLLLNAPGEAVQLPG